jgi:hypothetical protein
MDIVQLSELGLSSMLYDMFNNPMLQALAIGGSIAYVAFMYGKNTREKTIEKTLNYLIKEGYLHTDKDGDIKIIKK